MAEEAGQRGKSFRSFLGIPPSNPTPQDSVYVIIDAQNEYDHGLLAVSNVAESRANIGAVLKKYRDAGGDVVHVTHSTPEGAPLFTPGTDLSEEFSELKPREGEMVVHKSHPSSFTQTDLKEQIDKTGKKKIVLAGYMAHVCVSGTSRAGAELGYDVSVISDAIGDRDIPGASAKQLVDTVLAELGDVSATVIKASDL